ncbi:metallopeptidase TldD-related protein [Plantactinospora sp. KBS50]|uniref:metallopeptidase TldD-related protein n=1 Tax=Plantactinospora sp. KBS50 TaxID=2024580 RepID=UPI0012FE4F56|nr:metallopeptidase TldD-related protein [Plantactinospora sp. KBS50]
MPRASVHHTSIPELRGIEFDHRTARWELSWRNDLGQTTTRAADSLPDLVASIDRNPIVAASSEPMDTVRAGEPILLAPGVAGILLHELIGHAAEQGDLSVGTRVLPPGTDLRSLPARPDLDDEGVPVQAHDLVVDGEYAIPVHDRASGGPPSGDAWCAAHGVAPKARLIRLTVTSYIPGRSTSDGLVHVLRSTGGAYFHGFAMVNVALARRGTRPIAAVRLGVSIADLARGQWGPAGQVQIADGVCVKDGEALPSIIASPPLILEGASLWPA